MNSFKYVVKGSLLFVLQFQFINIFSQSKADSMLQFIIKNKDRAMKVLKAKLYEIEIIKQKEQISQISGARKKIDFGSQIRSYVLQPYQMIKDLRTNYESSDTQGVLDGEIDAFIESYLMSEENGNI